MADVLVLNIVSDRPPGEETRDEDGTERIGGRPVAELFREALEDALKRGQVWGQWEEGDQVG